ncbi:hypothetical protein M441DRAFT_307230 [Trichoderma asperellum CBS 433.97]|uniref:Uncharacterized protein n=1 Tax=Trichoderma asperellum (strain ATCC 204424 / CBS 433.97 / NBRC 101777) TaxID=1042311 RepID=A0A2T3ZK03_TRIA4|nr:hypothetical protein M441DRAFT_307230 [Trichoderma asperellum CBS 433.97]PTB45135.1 hypothetical protein M441DRAFT_307230 [Trichoderma asperellum CBS 433.97]
MADTVLSVMTSTSASPSECLPAVLSSAMAIPTSTYLPLLRNKHSIPFMGLCGSLTAYNAVLACIYTELFCACWKKHAVSQVPPIAAP